MTDVARRARATAQPAIEDRWRAGSVGIAGAASAGIGVGAVLIIRDTRASIAVEAAGALRLIAYADVVDAAPAVAWPAIGYAATAAGGDANVFRTTLGGRSLAAGGSSGRFAAGGGAAAARSTAIRLVDRAAFTRGFTEGAPGGAAELLAVAKAETAGVVTAFAVGGADSGWVAAVRAALLRNAGGTDACRAVPDLPTGTGNRFRGWGRAPCGLSPIVSEGTANGGDTSQPKQAFEYGAPAGARCQCLRKRIETTIVHSRTSLSPIGEAVKIDGIAAVC